MIMNTICKIIVIPVVCLLAIPLPAQEKPVTQSLRTDYLILNWTVSNSGKTIVAVGVEKKANRSVVRSQDIDGKILVIDAEKMKLVKTQALTKQLACLVTTDDAIFLFPRESQFIYRLKIENLKDRKKALMPGLAYIAQCDLNNKILARFRNKSGIITIDPETLKIVKDDPRSLDRQHMIREYRMGSVPTVIQRFQNIQLTRQIYYDLKKQKMIGLATPLRMFPTFEYVQNPYQQISRYASLGPWARHTNGRILTDDGGTQICALSNRSVISPDIPIIISENANFDGHSTRDARVKLVYRELESGEPLAEHQFYKINQRSIFNSHGQLTMQVRGRNVFAMHGESFYKTTIPKDVVTKATKTLHFQASEQPLIDLTKQQKIKFKISMTDNVEFELLTKLEHVTANKTTGEIAIDGPALWQKFQTDIKNSAQHYNSSRQYYWPDQQMESTEKPLAKLLNIPADKQPINLPLVIQATDETGFRAIHCYNLIAIGPSKEFLAAQQTIRDATIKRYREEQRALAESRRNQRYGRGDNRNSDPVGRRLDRLKSRIGYLENELQDLANMMDNYDKKGVFATDEQIKRNQIPFRGKRGVPKVIGPKNESQKKSGAKAVVDQP